MIVGDDGSPLSKRHGSFSVDEMRKQGYLPIAIINYMARLGHTCDTQALLDFAELAKHFYLEKLSRSPARFDMSQLMYWQKTAVQSLDVPAVWRWLGESIENQIPEGLRDTFAETIKANIEFPHDALMWEKIFFHEYAPIAAAEATIIHEAGEQFFVEAEQAVDKYGMDLARCIGRNESKH